MTFRLSMGTANRGPRVAPAEFRALPLRAHEVLEDVPLHERSIDEPGSKGAFWTTVYTFDREALGEVINRTVHAFLRFALAAAFLSAVADRFGLWGAPGGINVAWGEFPAFVEYTAQVNSFLLADLAPVLAWASTALELFLGLALIVGFRLRIAATASGALLLLFALAMTISFGVKAPLDFSVFTASAGAFLLAALPARPSTPAS